MNQTKNIQTEEHAHKKGISFELDSYSWTATHGLPWSAVKCPGSLH